jgi:hypothetical protein
MADVELPIIRPSLHYAAMRSGFHTLANEIWIVLEMTDIILHSYIRLILPFEIPSLGFVYITAIIIYIEINTSAT